MMITVLRYKKVRVRLFLTRFKKNEIRQFERNFFSCSRVGYHGCNAGMTICNIHSGFWVQW